MGQSLEQKLTERDKVLTESFSLTLDKERAVFLAQRSNDVCSAK